MNKITLFSHVAYVMLQVTECHVKKTHVNFWRLNNNNINLINKKHDLNNAQQFYGQYVFLNR